jgi:hypothetical protein
MPVPSRGRVTIAKGVWFGSLAACTVGSAIDGIEDVLQPQ